MSQIKQIIKAFKATHKLLKKDGTLKRCKAYHLTKPATNKGDKNGD